MNLAQLSRNDAVAEAKERGIHAASPSDFEGATVRGRDRIGARGWRRQDP
jgi:hypothetical protein